MNGWTLRVYHKLPAPARTLAANARGWYLRSWRYGPETERLIAEAIDRESWSDAKWHAWRCERLAYVLDRAARRVPFYRDYWRRHGGGRSRWEELQNWPRLSKDDVRDAPERFVADDCDIRRMFREHTSGTSGKPLDLWWSRATVREWYALFEARCRMWHGVSRLDRWAILGGQLVTPVARTSPPFWVWNAALNQLYLSSYHLSVDVVDAYLDALIEHEITYLWGYTSALYTLAEDALRRRRLDVRMKVVLTNAEPLAPHQRDTIARAFGCEVRETYGMAEIVASASECPHGILHTWPEVGIVEVGGDGTNTDDATGSLICTGLLNADMPLIRYAVGDRATLPAQQSHCGCGRTLPTIAAIDGRDDDVLVTRDGRRVGRLDPAFKAALQIREAQVVQEALDRIRVRYVPAPGFNTESARVLVAQLRDRLGEMDVTLEPVDRIPRTANGKFRAVVSELPRDGHLRVATSSW
jgi:phenylacetate-CoA ligase